jgi:hypothetical protein
LSGGRRDAWPTPDQELLLRAALLPDGRALAAWQGLLTHLGGSEPDLAAQSLLPIVRKNLSALGIDDEHLASLDDAQRVAWASNQLLLHRTLPVVAELERAGIPTVLLKGAAFLAGPGAYPGTRTMGDVDVLIPTEARGAAIDVLLEQGLVAAGGAPPWYLVEYAPRYVPSHGFEDGRARQLDLHWHVLHWSCQPDADDDFWAASLPVELLGVRTRRLCPADELLHVILHGLRWNAIPTYRWVLDAGLIASGACGEVDFERLVAQARMRRVVAPITAGLEYLRELADAPVSGAAISDLRSERVSRLERIEFQAHLAQPRSRRPIERRTIQHQQYVRRHLSLGEKPTLSRRVRLERRRLGMVRWRDVRQALAGGRPGPGRPSSQVAAAIGSGSVSPSVPPIDFGQPVELRDPEVLRRYVAYGAWLSEAEGPSSPEPAGCWLAGREARLVLPLVRPARASLLLGIWADGFLNARRRSQRLRVSVNEHPVSALEIDAPHANLRDEGIVLPREAIAGDRTLELTLEMPDAASPVELGLDDDDREIGVFLRRLVLREPPRYEIGGALELGEGAAEGAFAGGWGAPEPSGRWTVGARAQLLVRLDGSPLDLDLEFDASPLVHPSRRRLRVEVAANQHRLAAIDYDHAVASCAPARVSLPARAWPRDGELLLAWRIRNPISPSALGMSDDQRLLGLFIRRISLEQANRQRR